MVNIRFYSDFPPEIWFKVVIVNPTQCWLFKAPNGKEYVGYKAYFPFMEEVRLFDIVFPRKVLEREIAGINPKLRNKIDNKIEIEFKKNKKGKLKIKKFKPKIN